MDLKPSPALFDAYTYLSTAMSLGGLVAALIGAVIWARRAPKRHVLLAVASTSLLGVLLAVFVEVNIHGPTAIIMFVIMAAVVGVGLLLIAHLRPRGSKLEPAKLRRRVLLSGIAHAAARP